MSSDEDKKEASSEEVESPKQGMKRATSDAGATKKAAPEPATKKAAAEGAGGKPQAKPQTILDDDEDEEDDEDFQGGGDDDDSSFSGDDDSGDAGDDGDDDDDDDDDSPASMENDSRDNINNYSASSTSPSSLGDEFVSHSRRRQRARSAQRIHAAKRSEEIILGEAGSTVGSLLLQVVEEPTPISMFGTPPMTRASYFNTDNEIENENEDDLAFSDLLPDISFSPRTDGLSSPELSPRSSTSASSQKSPRTTSRRSLVKNVIDSFEEISPLGHSNSFVKALHRGTKKTVAIQKLAGKPPQLSAAHKVVKTLKDTPCPYVVKHYGSYYVAADAAVDMPRLWVIVQHCPLGSLQDILSRRERPFSEDSLASIAAQALEGLVFLHEHSVAHGSLSPSHILLADDGTVKLTAVVNNLVGGTGGIKDIAEYRKVALLPPEVITPSAFQLNGSSSYKQDLWGLGISLITLVEGNAPNSRNSRSFADMLQAVQKVLDSPPPSLRSPRQHSANFQNFIDLCLQKDPSNRPSATDLLNHQWIYHAQPDDVFSLIEGVHITVDRSTYREDLYSMINEKRFSDVEFITSEGQTLRLHKFVLSQRCPEFDRVLRAVQGLQVNVNLEYNALFAFAEWVYTGFVNIGGSIADVEEKLKPLLVVTKKFQLDSLFRLVGDVILKARQKPNVPFRKVLEIPHTLHPPAKGDFFDLTIDGPKFTEPVRSNWALVYTRSRWFRDQFDKSGAVATLALDADLPETPFRELHRYLYSDEIEEDAAALFGRDEDSSAAAASRLSTSDMMKLLVLAGQMKLPRLLQIVEVALSPHSGHKARGFTKFYQWALENGAHQLAKYIEAIKKKRKEKDSDS